MQEERSTWRLLREREHILRSKHRPLLQYLVMPSFTDTWCIDLMHSGDTLAAYHTVWRMTQDIKGFTTAIERLKHPRPFVPTLESTPLDISNDTIASLMSKLGGVTLPLKSIRNSISLDGTGYELQIGDGWRGLLLKWHNHLPDEWPDDLSDVVCQLNAMEGQLAG
jgi:hypothetical protein